MSMSKFRTLISTNALRKSLTEHPRDQLVILDAAFKGDWSSRNCRESYKRRHIPGARFFNLHQCVTSTPLVPRNIPETYCFTKNARHLGIQQDSNIVVYDHTKTPEAAARTWWLFRLFGHDRISILDGGLQKWVADGYEVTSEIPPPAESSTFSVKLNMNLIRDLEDMTSEIQNQSAQILDARNEALFSGSEDHSKDLSGGHIPGALNLPNKLFFNEDGTYKSPTEIRALFDVAGVDLNQPMISMCRTAMMATSLAAAAHILGRTQVPVYYGSWMEWGHLQSDLTEKSGAYDIKSKIAS